MEDIFSSSSSKIIQQQVEQIEEQQSPANRIESVDELDSYFDIERICSWLGDRKFTRVALQFPDELLNKSIQVCARLKLRSASQDANIKFFILADTSYGR